MQRDEIIEMAKEAGFWQDLSVYEGLGEHFKAFAKLVAAKEREAITDEYWSCIQSDLEHGVKSLSENAAKDFYTSMPELSKFGSWLEARGEA